MNKCIYEFASRRRDEAAATFSRSFPALSYQFNNSHGPNFLFADTQFTSCSGRLIKCTDPEYISDRIPDTKDSQIRKNQLQA